MDLSYKERNMGLVEVGLIEFSALYLLAPCTLGTRSVVICRQLFQTLGFSPRAWLLRQSDRQPLSSALSPHSDNGVEQRTRVTRLHNPGRITIACPLLHSIGNTNSLSRRPFLVFHRNLIWSKRPAPAADSNFNSTVA
jgi:hypothetical protein